jgi:hypothetical protein
MLFDHLKRILGLGKLPCADPAELKTSSCWPPPPRVMWLRFFHADVAEIWSGRVHCGINLLREIAARLGEHRIVATLRKTPS